MEGQERREQILKMLTESAAPLSGSRLAKMTGVSRQVIVQDIALLRAVNKNILATTKGYVLYHQEENKYHRTFKVRHKNEDVKDELYTIVDNGGKVLDVVVAHDVYGQISVDLILENRRDIDDFVKHLKESESGPIKNIAGGIHYHTVEASSEIILDNIANALNQKGYLIL